MPILLIEVSAQELATPPAHREAGNLSPTASRHTASGWEPRCPEHQRSGRLTAPDMGGYHFRALILPDFGAECSQRLIRWLHLLGPNRCQLCPWEVARCELPGPLLLQFGIGFPADLLSLPTARVEGAA